MEPLEIAKARLVSFLLTQGEGHRVLVWWARGLWSAWVWPRCVGCVTVCHQTFSLLFEALTAHIGEGWAEQNEAAYGTNTNSGA